MISPGVFFIFSKFWFTESIEGKMAKTTIQNDKKFCLLCSISQEPCIVWLSFMVLMFKMTISPDVFSVLHNFDLFGLSGGICRYYFISKVKLMLSRCRWGISNFTNVEGLNLSGFLKKGNQMKYLLGIFFHTFSSNFGPLLT